MVHVRLTYLFLCIAAAASAQDTPQQKIYVILKAGPSFFFTPAKKGTEQISFPYKVKSAAGGNLSDSSFVSNLFAPLQSMQTAIDFDVEIGSRNHFFEVSFGGTTSADNGSYIGLGYGRNFYVDLFGKHTKDPMQRNFVLKASLRISYYSFNRTLGSIDNLNKYIYIGSYTSEPTFTESIADPDNFTSTTTTYTTQNLNIAYLQRNWVLTPQVAVGNNQYKHIFHWEITAGAYISLSEAIGVKFTQEASDGHDQAGSFNAIGINSTKATFNGASVTTGPFRFSGLRIGFNIGIAAHTLKKNRTKDKKGL